MEVNYEHRLTQVEDMVKDHNNIGSDIHIIIKNENYLFL